MLAVSSGGGHWEELVLLRDALDGFDVTYATTDPQLLQRAGVEQGHILPDCNRDSPLRALHGVIEAFRLIRRLRPDWVLSTGAAPGFFCIVAGRLFGARTIWLDSVANAERMSMCGSLSRWCADLCLVQWRHLASGRRPSFFGSLL